MKSFKHFGVLSALACLATNAITAAQSSTVHNKLDHSNSRLGEYLANWVDQSTRLQSFYLEYNTTYEDRAFRTTEIFQGSARFQSPGMARLDVFDKESVVYTGHQVFYYQVLTETVSVFKQMPHAANRATWLFQFPYSILFPARQVDLYRYRVLSEDQDSVLIRLTSIHPKSSAKFSDAEVRLSRANWLPIDWRFNDPVGNVTTMRITRLNLNIKLAPGDFVGNIPNGWASNEHDGFWFFDVIGSCQPPIGFWEGLTWLLTGKEPDSVKNAIQVYIAEIEKISTENLRAPPTFIPAQNESTPNGRRNAPRNRRRLRHGNCR